MDQPRRTQRLARHFVVASLVVVACSVTGCKTTPACPAQTRTDAAKTVADHAAQNEGWTSLKAEARVTQWGEQGRIRGTVLMFLEKPDRVRFDVMTQVGPAAVLTSSNSEFQLSDLRENVFMHGPTCPDNISRLLGIAMDARNVLRLLTGDTPVIDAETESMECNGGRYVVTLKSLDGTTQEVAFAVKEGDEDKAPGDQQLELRRSRLQTAEGVVQWEANYGDYETVDGHAFPTRVSFVDNAHDTDTSVRIKSITVNPNVPADAFRQTARPGMESKLSPCP